MREGFAIWANPSSPHGEGRKARAALEDARSRVKAVLRWDGEVIFTSGASEALAIALGQAKAPLAAVSPLEHESVLRHMADAVRFEVSALGLVELATGPAGGLVAIQHANNETGVIQPLDSIAEVVRGAGGVLLADCAQTAGKLALPQADLIAISAHKFGGPIGIGALLVRNFGLLAPSGGQERGYRGGTENLPGALAMAAALEIGNGWMDRAAQLRQRLEKGLKAGGAEVVAEGAPRIATIGAYRMPGVSAAAQLIRFDAGGISVSAGSACSSGSLKPSHVLLAMGHPHPAEIIRVSIGQETQEAQIDSFLSAWNDIAGKARAA